MHAHKHVQPYQEWEDELLVPPTPNSTVPEHISKWQVFSCPLDSDGTQLHVPSLAHDLLVIVNC